MKYKIVEQHYDMAPDTVLYLVPMLTKVLEHALMDESVFTIREDAPREPYLRIVPMRKVVKVEE